MFRNSHRNCSIRRGVPEQFGKFTGKHLRQSLFFIEFASLRPVTLLKKRPWHRCFPWNFADFQERIFHRTPLDDCFCMFQAILIQLLEQRRRTVQKMQYQARMQKPGLFMQTPHEVGFSIITPICIVPKEVLIYIALLFPDI